MAIHPGLNSRYTVDQKKGEKTMAYLKGYVDHIRFRNEDNGYTVLSLDVDGDEETVVGSFPFLNDGEYISLEGDYVDHPVHGPQFQMRTYEIVAPDDIDSMERYLVPERSKESDLHLQNVLQRSLRWIPSELSKRSQNVLQK